MADQQGSNRKWNDLLAKAAADDQFRRRLMSDPAAALKESGLDTPSGVEIRVVENTDKVQYLVLPARTAAGLADLEPRTAEAVTGGGPYGPLWRDSK